MPDKKCKECFLKGCDCECETCIKARERNNRLSLQALMILQISHVMNDMGEFRELKKELK